MTEKLQTFSESWIIEDFKDVHHFAVALFCQKLFSSKWNPNYVYFFIDLNLLKFAKFWRPFNYFFLNMGHSRPLFGFIFLIWATIDNAIMHRHCLVIVKKREVTLIDIFNDKKNARRPARIDWWHLKRKGQDSNPGRLLDSNPARLDRKPSLYHLRHHRGLPSTKI